MLFYVFCQLNLSNHVFCLVFYVQNYFTILCPTFLINTLPRVTMYTPLFLERILDRIRESQLNTVKEGITMDMGCDDYIYNNFDQVIIEYRIIKENGGWPKLRTSKILKLGVQAPEVVTLRQRLEKTGDLVHSHATDIFDEIIDASVKLFQERHGLTTDGIVGPMTRAELNVPVEERIKQLERARLSWIMIPCEQKKVVVNIPGFKTIGTDEHGRVAIEMKTIVGRISRKTPVFREKISYAMLSPYWNVPYNIAVRDLLPDIKKAQRQGTLRSFFDSSGYEVFYKGVKKDPTAINWSQYSTNNFPYRLRQKPGPNNAMGNAKFMFPNRYGVYLHDTPAKSLFDRTVRAFSSGCMRLEDWRGMFRFLFPNFPEERVDQILESNVETKIQLGEKVPVYVVYMTAWIDSFGHVYFYPDIYGRES